LEILEIPTHNPSRIDMMLSVYERTHHDDDYDAAAALFRRGETLRRLRDLERLDEEERALANEDDDDDDHRRVDDSVNSTTSPQGHADENDSDSTLDYERFLATQRYYDDYKHVNYRRINFGFFSENNQKPLMITQSREYGKGGLVWDAGYILADHLIQTQELWNPSPQRPRRIIELGAGTGVTGLVLASALPECHVHLTDLSQLLPLLEENAKGVPNASVGELEWGTSLTESIEPYDLIVGSDVIAGIYDSVGLAKTIFDLSTDRSEVYLACRDRLAGSLEQFEGYLRCLFTHVERRHAVSRNKNPTVWMMYASGRRSPEALEVTLLLSSTRTLSESHGTHGVTR